MNVNNTLENSVSIIKGIGEETESQLASMGIFTVLDLLEHFPYRFDDYRLRDLQDVEHDEKVTVEGKVQSEPSLVFYNRKRSRLTIHLLVGKNLIKVFFFNQPYLKKKISISDTITVSGKWDRHRGTITAQELKIGPYQKNADFEPVYTVRGSLTVKSLRKFIRLAFQSYGNQINENLPEDLIKKYKLLPRRDAMKMMHFPITQEDVKQARRRFVYEEFLFFQLKMQALRKFEREHSGGISQHYDLNKLRAFFDLLPFPLTNAQKRVINEICADLKSPYRMNRLLQGDVGSGKTVVAAVALFASWTAGFQGALMVPTEILAEQHAVSLQNMLGQAGLNIELLTSSIKGKKREGLLERLRKGEIHVLVGTHALIQDDVHFNKLGLVITDEQHRFGVEQRRVLREKGVTPDVLFMTATPIPRTLAITAFGEMDVSVIDEMPAGRKRIETYWVKNEMLEKVLRFVEKELIKERQAYIICPLIEESEKLDLQNAIDVYQMLTDYYYDKFKVGLMHGRLHPAEKENVMKAFSDNDIQILVSTTVVEVGVNVPNATIMVIYDAERFGLSQLHQLRGRVGRGQDQSYCFLLANPKTDVGKERMKIMIETNDGFVLSEKDLELRGPGDFFGKKQSGLPEFKVADMVHDYRALEVARNDAAQLINQKDFWHDQKYHYLRKYLEESGVMDGEKLD
ncbi:ATP-dependent DNA helicase RecG [Heyndrickxia sporothermodurans]|uniref:ATP-dependent DNA helicase RecG n=2 Tax=Heyndrickxia sporothermodurans TaxID=46224 RepID=A0AB37HJN5_9BACI|nr:ATP-dependent DNA helicase RecG [Heyndrickxia sporothermodurans]MBL5767918.1 ATP-dependent DNA helicase RecG [Heyndrickxia sporothermodurans]MBL5772560.1 ATP-dependent DNA helicase RecG [Heyndrickxia sporothermodurans]MBL5775191.1 ATP-dependent DNA helicase RecG [Heyndrickxia sporothermodurans]MBL5782220.1 ATP-dependent DNA helicase RecG [Heyndrickxia sporothermodurans]MBL5785809.1 ATP-dependent DNA helicase RecG [Heyndrickxia sporothermodurans]